MPRKRKLTRYDESKTCILDALSTRRRNPRKESGRSPNMVEKVSIDGGEGAARDPIEEMASRGDGKEVGRIPERASIRAYWRRREPNPSTPKVWRKGKTT